MLFRVMLLTFAIVVSTPTLARPGRAESAAPVDACPGYRAALLKARAALADGDRPRAVVELERAKAALRDCGREATGKPSLLAALPADVPRSQ